MNESMSVLLEQVIAIARQAGDLVMEVYGSDFAVRGKLDASPVTAADLAAQLRGLEQVRQIFSPFFKQSYFIVHMTVKKIAHNDQLFWLKELHLCHQALQIFFKNSLRNTDPFFAKMTALSKMNI